jgi:glycosyltransferase involved in cell wall biosynthesis
MIKNIVFIMDIPEDTGSFIGRYYSLGLELSKLEYNITIMMPRHDARDITINDNFRIKCIGKPLYQTVNNKRIYDSSFKLSLLLLKYIYKYLSHCTFDKVDLLYVCKPLPATSIVGLLLKLFGKKVIVDVDDLEVVVNNAKNKLQYLAVSIAENNLPKVATKVVTHTNYLKNKLIDNGVLSQNIVRLPNGVDPDRFAISNLITNRDYFSILYFGDINISTGHNVDLLIKSLSYLQLKPFRFKLTIIGDGKDLNIMKKLSRELGVIDNIEWLGRLAPNGIVKHLYNSDVTIDPVHECIGNLSRFPLKIIESAYCGVPIITSQYGERPNILGKYGIYAEADNSEDLANKIFDLYNESEEEKNKRRKGLIKLSEKYTWVYLAKIFEKEVINANC